MSGPQFHRRALLEATVDGIVDGPPQLLAGPLGSGKSSLMRAAAETLTKEGWLVVQLDLLQAAASPESFVDAALAALPAERFAGRLREATEIREFARTGREGSPGAVEALLDLWSSLDTSAGQPVALLLDEVSEIRTLSTFKGLRGIEERLVATLQARARGTLAASSFPGLAPGLPGWPRLASAPLHPDSLSDFLGVEADRAAACRAAGGIVAYAQVLVEGLRQGLDLAGAWAEEMAPGGRLETACHRSYESLLLRSRGYGMAKATLFSVAGAEGSNLTALVKHVGRTPGAVRDYLGWLLDVGALRMEKKRYYFEDPLLRTWVRLYGRGSNPSRRELEEAADVATAGRAVRLAAATRRSEVRRPEVKKRRDDSLIEID